MQAKFYLYHTLLHSNKYNKCRNNNRQNSWPKHAVAYDLSYHIEPHSLYHDISTTVGGFAHGDIPMSKLLNGGRDVEVHATTAQGIKC